MPCNCGTTMLSMKDIAVNDLHRDDFDHDCYSDCMVTACHESDGNSDTVATHDEEPCKVHEEALALSPRCTEHDSSTLPEKKTIAATLTSCDELKMKEEEEPDTM